MDIDKLQKGLIFEDMGELLIYAGVDSRRRSDTYVVHVFFGIIQNTKYYYSENTIKNFLIEFL